jgi:RNA polymerase sigma-70 factor (sigma-E family)
MPSTRRAAREAEFTDFARARMPHLYRSAWLLCGDQHRAEDLVQETLTKVYGRWGPSIDNPAAYAQTTLTHTWISQLRRRSNHERPVDQVPEKPQSDGDDALRLTLIAALNQLEPLDRAVVILRYRDDVSTHDVARQLGLSNAAVRNRSMRALQRLRDHLNLPFSELIEGATA